MRKLTNIIYESSIDDEIKEWEKTMATPFGKTLQKLQKEIANLDLYPQEEDENGLNVFTPIDNYVVAFALDNNKKYTYEVVNSICTNYEYTEYDNINKLLKKLKKLI